MALWRAHYGRTSPAHYSMLGFWNWREWLMYLSMKSMTKLLLILLMMVCARIDLLRLYLDFILQWPGQIRCDNKTNSSLAAAHPVLPSPCNPSTTYHISKCDNVPRFLTQCQLQQIIAGGQRGKTQNVVTSYREIISIHWYEGNKMCNWCFWGGSCMLTIMSNLPAFTICVQTKWSLED